jgi:predicted transcriptional regulator
MTVHRDAITVRLKPGDREFVRRLAEYYDISESDVLRMALREFIERHGKGGFEVKTSQQ